MTVRGVLHLSGYGGDSTQVVEIVGRTPKRIRIRAIERTRLAGRCRWLEPGHEVLVPEHAVTPLSAAESDDDESPRPSLREA